MVEGSSSFIHRSESAGMQLKSRVANQVIPNIKLLFRSLLKSCDYMHPGIEWHEMQSLLIRLRLSLSNLFCVREINHN